MTKAAILSPDGSYRYWLCRYWGSGPACVFLMLNPSTADADIDDPTIRKCMKFAKAWGYPGIEVVNLFAFRATDPKQLKGVSIEDAVGPGNSSNVRTAVRLAGIVVCAWGSSEKRWREALKWLDLPEQLHCLGVNADDSPKHPLYLKDDTQPIPWEKQK